MLKPVLLSLVITATTTSAAFAQGWVDTDGATASDTTSQAAQGSTQGNASFATGSQNALNAGHGYELQNPGRSAFGGWNTQGYANQTGKNKVNLPPVVTAMPIMVDGVNTGLTGGSIALRTQLHSDGSPALMPLPQTHINSLAAEAEKYGVAESIYGQESTTAPAATHFKPINDGIHSDDLTTGHKSDAAACIRHTTQIQLH